ncbi:hypothetical protein BSIN_2883 [Burkholderia singularis]|uniref:Uncharacterized protein n=1 Tax=Burkholderia singularis TaxID=1503053 RepID=A0A238H3C0_9BURK|nr:hypothetical protein BSIN_2883 [Burkholderia singularis]
MRKGRWPDDERKANRLQGFETKAGVTAGFFYASRAEFFGAIAGALP